jgi:hypothetical protein
MWMGSPSSNFIAPRRVPELGQRAENITIEIGPRREGLRLPVYSPACTFNSAFVNSASIFSVSAR